MPQALEARAHTIVHADGSTRERSMRGAGIAFAAAGIALAVLVVVFAPQIGAALLGLLAFWGAR